ncbi:MAG TPA: hypothetical protein VGJ80_10680 [Gemmatimonadales bacterium]
MALAALFSCKISTDADQPVAIEITLPDSSRVEVTNTFRPSGRALNDLGDSVQAPLFWRSLDTAIIAVLDSTTGLSIAKTVQIGRLQARTGNLVSNPQNVTVLARPDSMRAGSATRDTVFVTPVPPDTMADSLSDSLIVNIFATGGAAVARRIVYVATTFPASDSTVTLLPNDSVLTSSTGVAFARVKLRKGPVPDSVVVTATMRRLDRTVVPDSVMFVVEFRP